MMAGGILMFDLFFTSIILVTFGVTLLKEPWKYIGRHTDIPNEIKSKPLFKKSIRFFGWIFLFIGVLIDIISLLKI